jgi:hypothetical protein
MFRGEALFRASYSGPRTRPRFLDSGACLSYLRMGNFDERAAPDRRTSCLSRRPVPILILPTRLWANRPAGPGSVPGAVFISRPPIRYLPHPAFTAVRLASSRAARPSGFGKIVTSSTRAVERRGEGCEEEHPRLAGGCPCGPDEHRGRTVSRLGPTDDRSHRSRPLREKVDRPSARRCFRHGAPTPASFSRRNQCKLGSW